MDANEDCLNEKGWMDVVGSHNPGPPQSLCRLIMDHGVSGLVIIDELSVIIYANRAFEALSGHPLEDLPGKTILELLAGDDEKNIREFLTDQRDPGRSDVRVLEFKRPDGCTRTAEVHVMGVRTEKGKACRVVTAMDISAHKKTGSELAESEKKYRLLVENIEEFFFEQSIEGGFVFFNEAMVRHSGFSREELGTMNFRDYILPEDWDRVVDFYAGILKTGKPASGLLIRGRMKDGSLHYYEVRSNLKTDEKGRKVGFRSYCRDVTAEKRAEAEMLKMQEALEAKVVERTKELQDINTALEVLLKKRENDKKSLEDRVIFSIKEMIAPHIELLKKTALDSRQAMYVETLEQNFAEICSPFMQILAESLRKLTPTEIQILNLVKQNKSSKQIAGFLGVSPRTVEFHRDNIRNKIGIKNKKQSLRTHLLSEP